MPFRLPRLFGRAPERVAVTLTFGRYVSVCAAVEPAYGDGPFDPATSEPERLVAFLDALTDRRDRFATVAALRQAALVAWGAWLRAVDRDDARAKRARRQVADYHGWPVQSSGAVPPAADLAGSLDGAEFAALRDVPLGEALAWLVARSIRAEVQAHERNRGGHG